MGPWWTECSTDELFTATQFLLRRWAIINMHLQIEIGAPYSSTQTVHNSVISSVKIVWPCPAAALRVQVKASELQMISGSRYHRSASFAWSLISLWPTSVWPILRWMCNANVKHMGFESSAEKKCIHQQRKIVRCSNHYRSALMCQSTKVGQCYLADVWGGGL